MQDVCAEVGVMREILFRGRMASGAWVYGDLLHYYNGEVSIAEGWSFDRPMVEAETVGQYTGLKDKHDVKIFEGDIVRAVLPQTDAQAGFVWPARSIGYFDGCFGFYVLPRFDITPLHSFAPTVEFEVIGNVYDNPELREVDNAAD